MNAKCVKSTLGTLIVTAFVFGPSFSYASAVDVEVCVSNLRAHEHFTAEQAIQACAGAKSAAAIEVCVSNLKNHESFSNDQAARVCAGAMSGVDVEVCVSNLKNHESFNNDQAVNVCRSTPVCQ